MRPDKIIVLGSGTVREGKIEDTITCITQCIARNKMEPGCLYSKLHINKKEPNKFVTCEMWESQGAWLTHLQKEHVHEFGNELETLMTDIQLKTYIGYAAYS